MPSTASPPSGKRKAGSPLSTASPTARAAGLGFAQELADKRLVRVLDSFCVPFPGFFLYYPSRAHLAPKLKALIEFFKLPPRRAE